MLSITKGDIIGFFQVLSLYIKLICPEENLWFMRMFLILNGTCVKSAATVVWKKKMDFGKEMISGLITWKHGFWFVSSMNLNLQDAIAGYCYNCKQKKDDWSDRTRQSLNCNTCHGSSLQASNRSDFIRWTF